MRKFLFAAAALPCLILSHAFAQTSNATLGGTVSDASGALIPGVSITATNVATGIVTSVLSNEAGAYQFASLQTGTYRVSAELMGFQTQTYSDVALGVSQQVRLNFTLQVGGVSQAVEVTVAADTLIATSSSSVGAVLPEYKVRDLPLLTRNVIDLVGTTAGTVGSNFAGARPGQVNTTRDGIVVSDGRYLEANGAFSTTYTSPDLVEEVRVIVAPADAETGRGSGQVQMATRSGTNQFRGALFWMNGNSALGANTWFNNFNGVGKNYQNRNQFGGRIGGPVIRNKTFFFFLYEGQRYVTKEIFTGSVLTADARKGIFRYFPGVENGNAFAGNPTVDLLGNPVIPGGATGPLASFSVFGRDPQRPGFDTSGFMQRLIARMPLPNDFTTCGTSLTGTLCDGLNTAGYRWVRRIEGLEDNTGASPNTNRNQYNVRIDHSFNTNHKLSFTGTKENNCCISPGTARITNWPGGYSGHVIRNPDVYTAGLVSTLSPTIVNEARAGLRRSHYYSWGSYALPGKDGDEARAFLPQSNGILLVPKPTLFPEHLVTNGVNSTRGQRSPLYMYSDTVSWTRGTHAFKGGGEVRFTGSNGFNAEDIDAVRGFFGPGGVAVRGIDSTIPGLIGANQTTAQDLLIDLAGSLQRIREGFSIVDAKNPRFVDSRELKEKWRYWRQREFSTFFKDDWKLRPNLTLNLGIRYEFYGVPWEAQGLAGRPVGGKSGLFGISGTSFADWWNPGAMNGSMTKVELVGKNSPQPDKQIYNDDWNNFAPAVGLSWSLPWWGKDKTILRAGYGVSYQGAVTYIGLDGAVGNLPGLNLFVEHTTADYLSLSNFSLPVPQSTSKPLEPIPLTDRQQTIQGYEDDHVNPYIQNWNLELQHELARNFTLEARYVGSKATKLWTPFPLNDVNIFENGILNAYNVTRAGGDALLFDQMLDGLVMNTGQGPVNGTTVTGSAALRQNTLFRAFIANGDIGQFASLLNTSTTVTGQGGGLVRKNGFPENFIVVNPQFQTVTLHANVGNSTYHSMQLQVTKRLSQGLTNQTSYTWSRTLGQTGTGETNPDRTANYRNPRNIALDKGLLSYHRTHSIRSNGTYELPFGPNRTFLNSAPSLVQRLVERWQLGGIFSWSSGAPLDILASTSSITATTPTMTTMTPNLVGNFPKSTGKVTKLANGVSYLDGFRLVTDPTIGNVTMLQGVRTAFGNRAIADSQGRIVLVNPAPGEVGNLGARWIEGPARLGLDMNLVKRVRIDETKEFELRVDAINVLNMPFWDNPITDINAPNFGRIIGNATNNAGNRAFIINARVNF